MSISMQQVEQFKQDVINQFMNDIHICVKCYQHRYSKSQVVARFRLMDPSACSLLFVNLDSYMARLKDKYKCNGCVELKMTSVICLMLVLRRVKAYDARTYKR